MVLAAGVVALWLVGSFPARAAEGTAATPEDVLFQDIPTVVTPSRMPQKPWHSPSSVEVVTYDTIERWGVGSVADLLRRVAGVDVRQRGVDNMVGPRGATATTQIYNVLVLLDGVPVTDPLFGSFNLGPDFPLEVIKQVEVVRGPGSSLWGANAYAGVVNIITKKPSDLAGTRVGLGVGSHKAVNGSYLRSEPGVGTEWLAGVRGTFTDARDDHAVNDNDFMRDGDVFARLLRGRGDVFAYSSRSTQGRPGSILTDSPTDTVENENTLLRGTWRLLDDPGRCLVVNTVYCAQDGSFPGGPVPVRPPRIDFDSERFGTNLQWTSELTRRQTLVAGLDFWRKSSEWHDIKGEHHSTERAVFFQDEVRLDHRWNLTLGARYDDDSTFGGMLSPRISANRRMDERRTLRLSVGHAFRAPTFSEQYIDASLGAFLHVLGNPDLKPEEVLSYQAGYSHNVSSRFRYDVDLFLNRSTDRIGSVFGPPVGLDPRPVVTTVNFGETTARGLELSLRDDLSSRARLTFNYSFQRVFDSSSGAELAYAPKHKANLIFDVDHNRRVFSSLSLHWVDERWTEGLAFIATPVRLEGFVTSDLRIGRRHGRTGKGFTALTVYNVFDKRYEESGDYPMAGRTVALEYVTRF